MDDVTNTTEGAQLLTGLLKDLDIYPEDGKEKGQMQGEKDIMDDTQNTKADNQIQIVRGKKKEEERNKTNKTNQKRLTTDLTKIQV